MKNINYRSIIIVTTFAIVLAISFRSFLFASYVVDGKSMEPTLNDGNLLMVNKFIYELHEVDRFDVIVFQKNKQDAYVKRVVGLPGDEIEYKADEFYVNGEYREESFLDSSIVQASDTPPNTDDFTLTEKTGRDEVPEGKLFVMGDNRDSSLDSRSFGFISMEQLVGKVDVKYWPLTQASFTLGK
ncbi:signal peptidase I [Virgibacillus natechei]|uniref:Signal peptidase I n=1 Tax=Virgibacillus natechei TaxID=1216297 RepID=A0ABS4IEF4_9BACI|nr:signal peptidase I [Virgibacillus natechei]MBP1969005.1 signal peptidase I [Virgibacillus natechei]UZD14282.1 signal peptidase I [Virgibacillus natechei]